MHKFEFFFSFGSINPQKKTFLFSEQKHIRMKSRLKLSDKIAIKQDTWIHGFNAENTRLERQKLRRMRLDQQFLCDSELSNYIPSSIVLFFVFFPLSE